MDARARPVPRHGDRLELRFLFTTRAIPLGSIASVRRRRYEITWADHRGVGDFALGTDVLEIRYTNESPTEWNRETALPSGVPSTVPPDSRAFVSPADEDAFLFAIGHNATQPAS